MLRFILGTCVPIGPGMGACPCPGITPELGLGGRAWWINLGGATGTGGCTCPEGGEIIDWTATLAVGGTICPACMIAVSSLGGAMFLGVGGADNLMAGEGTVGGALFTIVL